MEDVLNDERSGGVSRVSLPRAFGSVGEAAPVPSGERRYQRCCTLRVPVHLVPIMRCQ